MNNDPATPPGPGGPDNPDNPGDPHDPSDLQAGEVLVGDEEGGLRLDKVLAGRLKERGLSRSRLQALIRRGEVCKVVSAGQQPPVTDPAKKVAAGERYQVNIPPPEAAELRREEMALDIVFEDDHVIVVNKPAGLVVHPAPGHDHGTLVNGLLAHCGDTLSGIGGVRRPGIVHRLDKDTSGLMVVAKTDAAHQGLSKQFQLHGRDGRLSRRYLALVWGAPAYPKATINAPLARASANRQKIEVVAEGRGRQAITHYRVLQRFYNTEGRGLASLLSCELETGRTHQIRVHLAYKGFPVLSDATYGSGFAASARNLSDDQRHALSALGRQALHAVHLGFEHPKFGTPMSFEADMPLDLANLVAKLAVN